MIAASTPVRSLSRRPPLTVPTAGSQRCEPPWLASRRYRPPRSSCARASGGPTPLAMGPVWVRGGGQPVRIAPGRAPCTRGGLPSRGRLAAANLPNSVSVRRSRPVSAILKIGGRAAAVGGGLRCGSCRVAADRAGATGQPLGLAGPARAAPAHPCRWGRAAGTCQIPNRLRESVFDSQRN